jgi:hypothetical protein
MKKISKYGFYITKTVYYEVYCCVVVGWVLKATMVLGSDSAGTLCELPATLIFCPNVRVDWLP